MATTRAAIFAIAKELRDAPADPDLVDRARRPLVEAMTKARRENAKKFYYDSAEGREWCGRVSQPLRAAAKFKG